MLPLLPPPKVPVILKPADAVEKNHDKYCCSAWLLPCGAVPESLLCGAQQQVAFFLRFSRRFLFLCPLTPLPSWSCASLLTGPHVPCLQAGVFFTRRSSIWQLRHASGGVRLRQSCIEMRDCYKSFLLYVVVRAWHCFFKKNLCQDGLCPQWRSPQKSRVGRTEHLLFKGWGRALAPKRLRIPPGSCFKVFIFFLAHRSCWNIEPSSTNITVQRINHLLHENTFLKCTVYWKKWHFSKRWHFWPVGHDWLWWIETPRSGAGVLNHVRESHTAF